MNDFVIVRIERDGTRTLMSCKLLDLVSASQTIRIMRGRYPAHHFALDVANRTWRRLIQDCMSPSNSSAPPHFPGN